MPDQPSTIDPADEGNRDRSGAFYVVYVGLFLLLFAYLITVRVGGKSFPVVCHMTIAGT